MYCWDIWEDEPIHIWTSDEPMIEVEEMDLWDSY